MSKLHEKALEKKKEGKKHKHTYKNGKCTTCGKEKEEREEEDKIAEEEDEHEGGTRKVFDKEAKSKKKFSDY